MTYHVDPASAEFEQLPRREQARIYHAMGWDKSAIAEELGARTDAVSLWLNPEAMARRRELDNARRRTPEGRARARAYERRKREQHRAALLAAGQEIPQGGRQRSFNYEEAARLRAQGMKVAEIAARFGVCLASIHNALKAVKEGRA